MPNDQNVPDRRKRLEAFSALWGDQAARSLELFDKFDAIGWGEKAYYFILRFQIKHDVKPGLDKLEKIYEECGRDESKRCWVGMEMYFALR